MEHQDKSCCWLPVDDATDPDGHNQNNQAIIVDFI